MAPVVAFVAAAVAKVTVAAVVKFVVTTAFSIGVSRLLAKRAIAKAQAGGDGGGRVQLPPATDNKIPVVYGSAFTGGPIIDAYLTPDQKTMYYVVALSEVTDNGTISYGDIYYDGKLVQFGSDGSGGTTKVTALINNNVSPTQTDTRVNGFLNIYLYKNGSTGATSGTNTTQNAYDVFPGWGTSTYAMTDCAFAIIKVVYSTDAGTTGLGSLTAQVKNTENGQTAASGIYRPGTALKDYMMNTRYGCAIPLAQIDTASLDDVNTYSDQTITVTGGPSPTQARYRINGPLDTAQNCLTNLQYLVDTCDSWLQYSELQGKWKVVLNKAYTQTPNAQTLNDLFLVNSSNLVGGIEISPIDLNETYNQTEVAYPNLNVKDQTDYQIINLFDTNPSLLSQNEAVNRLNITLPLVNNAVQAKYLAARRIYQSREDLVVSFRTDYSGIQVEAGDVVRITHETYGWTDKLFRVSEVIEEKDMNGNLFASFRAFEYNATVYVDDPVADFIPAFNTGLKDPNIISAPCDPVITNFTDTQGLITGFEVESCVPEEGLVLYMDFNYGNNSNVLTHLLYRTLQQSNGTPFTNSPDIANGNVTSVIVDVNDLPAGNLYWSVTARNNTAGKRSGASNVFPWGGANIQPYNSNTGNGGLPGNVYRPNSIPANAIAGSVGVTVQEEGINVITNGQTLNFRGIGFDITAANSTRANIALDGNLTISQRISGNNFSINEGNPQANLAPVLLPVDATANSTRNVPIYFIGVDPGANNIYPYYQGTARDTAGSNGNNYYQANSTGAWTPSTAAILTAGDGEDNWYAVCTDSFANGSLVNNQAYFINAGFTAVTDTPGTILQIVQGFKTGNNAFYFSDTNRMDTLEMLSDTTQFSWERLQTEIFSNASSITGGAVLVRCITDSANVIITSGSIVSSKGQTPFV
jgi:hypothetical protein